MADYSPTIKVKLADAVTADESVWADGIVEDWTGARCTLGAMGGCLGATLRIGKTRALEAGFDIPRGAVVEFWHSATERIYTGWVASASRAIGSNEHVYELKGFWERLTWNVAPSPATNFGALASQHPELPTTGDIAKWITGNWIEPAGVGVIYDAALITGAVEVSELALREQMSVQETIIKLAYLESSAGVPVLCGVGSDRKLFFHIPGLNIKTLTKGYNILSVEEIMSGGEPAARLVIKGDAIPTSGYWARKSYWKPDYVGSVDQPAYGRPRLVKVPGIYRKIDMDAFAAGYFVRHAVEAAAVHGVGSVTATDVLGIESPWLARARYVDTVKGLELDAYIGSVDIEFGPVCVATYNLGLDNPNDIASAAGDPYAPSARDVFGGVGNPENLWADDLYELPEADETMTEVGGPDEDYPHLVGPDTPGGGGGGEPGTTTTLLELHGHQGYYDGGWAGYMTGGL